MVVAVSPETTKVFIIDDTGQEFACCGSHAAPDTVAGWRICNPPWCNCMAEPPAREMRCVPYTFCMQQEWGIFRLIPFTFCSHNDFYYIIPPLHARTRLCLFTAKRAHTHLVLKTKPCNSRQPLNTSGTTSSTANRWAQALVASVTLDIKQINPKGHLCIISATHIAAG